MKVCIMGHYGNHDYASMFLTRGWDTVEDPHEADLLQFTGGADVHPIHYSEESHPTTHSDLHRDREDHITFLDYAGKPMAGICRGGQFLNVMNGGKLYQDVDGHALSGTHGMLIGTPDGNHHRIIRVTSTHHQMMRPSKDGHVLAYAHESVHREYMRKHHIVREDEDYHDDVEVVLYRDTNCLCFQPHPELDRAPQECTDYYFELIDQLMEE